MKQKIIILIISLFVLSVLSACKADNTDEFVIKEMASVGIIPPNEEYTNVSVYADGNRNEEFAIPLPREIKISLPGSLPSYTPVAQRILPITSNWSIYWYHVETESRELYFIDIETGERFAIPAQAKNFSAVRERIDGRNVTVCFVLYDEHRNSAIMLPDGTMTTGFDYKLIEENTEGNNAGFVHSNMGYIRAAIERNGEEKFGVLSIETGSVAIPFEYDEIMFFDKFVMAVKGKNVMAMDYSGNAAHTFYDAYVEFSMDGRDGYGGIGAYEATNRYNLDLVKEIAYNISHVRIYRVSENFRVLLGEKWEASVYSIAGEHIITILNYINYHEHNDELFFEEVRAGHNIWATNVRVAFICVKKDGSILSIPDIHRLGWVQTISRDGDVLVVVSDVEPGMTTGHFRRTRLSETGDFISEETYHDERYGGNHNSESGNETTPFDEYDEIYQRGPFIIAHNGRSNDENLKISVLNEGGKILAYDIYWYITGLPDENVLIIYKDPDTCGRLDLNGVFSPIENTPRVIRKYTYGG